MVLGESGKFIIILKRGCGLVSLTWDGVFTLTVGG